MQMHRSLLSLFLLFCLLFGAGKSYAQNNFRLRYLDRVIDSTQNVHHKLCLMSYTLVQSSTEDSLYMRNLFGRFRKTFATTYSGKESSLDYLGILLDNHAAGNHAFVTRGFDSLCKHLDRKNVAAANYFDYFQISLRHVEHEESEHAALDSIFYTAVANTQKTKMYGLTALLYFSRAGYMSVHENKPEYLGHREIKYAQMDTAVSYAVLDANEVLRMKILAGHARYAGLERHFNLCQQKCLKVLPMAMTLNDSASLYIVYTMMSIVNLEMKNFKEAERYALLNYNLAMSLNDYARITTASGRLMELYGAMHDTVKALHYGRLSVTNSTKAGNRYTVPLTLGNYGEILLALGFIDSAKYYQKVALEMRIETGNKEGELYSYNSLASIALAEKECMEALDYTNKAWALEQERQYGSYNERIFHNFYAAYAGLKNWEKALFYLEKYSATKRVSDSVNNASDMMTKQSEFESKIVEGRFEHSIMLQKLAAEAEKAAAGRTRNLLIGGLVVLLLIAGLILRGFNQKRKANSALSSKNLEIELQKAIVDEKQKEIVDSITYAKRIQYTLLAHDELLKENLNEYFVLFKPKDIVSGDFYWATKSVGSDSGGGRFYLAVCDSTGHGVPGAFMSLLNISFLNEAITEKQIASPELVLRHVRERLLTSVSKDGAQDGMDGVLLCFNKNEKNVSYAAAYNSPVLISDGVVTVLPSDKMPVGRGVKEQDFILHNITYKPGDLLYLITDGYADQFGGPKGKKFKHKQLHEVLLANHSRPLEEQRKILEDTIDAWRGNLEQVDDICVIGIKL